MTSATKTSKTKTTPQVSDSKTGDIKLLAKEKWHFPEDLSRDSPKTADDEDIEAPTSVKRMFPYPEKELTTRPLYVSRYEEKGIRVVDSDVAIQGLLTLESYLASTSFPELENTEEFAVKNFQLKIFFSRLLDALITQEKGYKEARYRRHQKRKDKELVKSQIAFYGQLQDARLQWDGRTHGRYPYLSKSRWC